MPMMPPLMLELRANATEVLAKMKEVNLAAHEMAEKTEIESSRMKGSFNKAASGGKILATGMGIGALAIGALSVKAAADAQVVDAKLSTAFKNAGSSMEEMEPKVKKLDASQRNYGFTNDETNTALATLTTALHDPKKAMADLAVASDLARQKGISLDTAAMAVAKTAQGQSRALMQLGIQLPITAASGTALAAANKTLSTAQQKVTDILKASPDAANKASKAHKSYESALAGVAKAQSHMTDLQSAGGSMLAALTQRVHGAASAYGNTLQGQLKSAGAGLESMAENIGGVLIPVLERVIKTGQQWAAYLGQHKPLLIGIAMVIGGVLGTMLLAYIAQLVTAGVKSVITFGKMVASSTVWVAKQAAAFAMAIAHGAAYAATTVATLAVTAAKWVWNSAKTVGALAIQNAAIIGQKAILIGSAVVLGVVTAAQWLWNLAMDANPIGLLIAGIVLLIGIIIIVATKTTFFQTLWKGAVAVIGAAWSWLWNNIIRPIGEGIGTAIEAIGSTIGRVFGAISGVIRGAFDGVAGFIKGIINSIINVINGAIGGINLLISGINLIPGVHVGLIGKIPSLDVGGTIPGRAGAPTPILAHGREEMLSLDMLSGKQPIRPEVTDAVAANAARFAPQPKPGGGDGGRSGPTVIVHATTNASPARIAAAMSWELRRLG